MQFPRDTRAAVDFITDIQREYAAGHENAQAAPFKNLPPKQLDELAAGLEALVRSEGEMWAAEANARNEQREQLKLMLYKALARHAAKYPFAMDVAKRFKDWVDEVVALISGNQFHDEDITNGKAREIVLALDVLEGILEADNGSGAKREATGDGEPPDYIDLDQAAALVGRSKRTLERRLSARNNPMPPADIDRGGGGKKNEWIYATLKPWLEKEYSRKLPSVR
jgi:hypothetical protein